MRDNLYNNRYFSGMVNYPIILDDIVSQEIFTRNCKVVYGVVHEYFTRIHVAHKFSVYNNLLHVDFFMPVDNSLNTIVVEIPNFKFERRERVWYVGGSDYGLITPNVTNVVNVYYDQIFSIYDAFKYVYKYRLEFKQLI